MAGGGATTTSSAHQAACLPFSRKPSWLLEIASTTLHEKHHL